VFDIFSGIDFETFEGETYLEHEFDTFPPLDLVRML
jgi:hypothetical protein